MQLPHVLASANLASPAPALRDPRAAGAPWEGIAHLGGALVEAAETRLVLERRKREISAQTDALKIASDIELELASGMTALKRTETDPDRFASQSQAMITQISESIPARSDKPLVQQYLSRHLPRLIGKHQLETLHTADGLFVDRQKALGTQIEENYHQAIGQTPWDDHQTISEIAGRGINAIEGQVHTYGESETAKRVLAFKHRVNAEVAARHAHDAPDDFLDKIDSYTGLTPEMRNNLETRAERRSDHLRTQGRVERDRYEADLQRKFKEEQDRRVGELKADLFNRTPGTLEKIELNGPRGTNVLGDHYEHLRKMWTHPQDDASDPETLHQVVRGIVDGTMTSSHLMRLNEPGPDGRALLADKDLTKYQNAIEHKARLALSGDPTLVRRQAQTDKIMGNFLATRGSLLEAMTPLESRARTLRGQFEQEMLERSRTYGIGKEDPYDVMNDIGPKYVRQFRDEFTETIKTLTATINTFQYKSRMHLDAARDAGQIKPKEYEKQAKAWDQLNAALTQKAELIKQADQLFKPSGRR